MTDVLQHDRVRAEIDPERGARLTGLSFDGLQVLAAAEDPTVDPDIADGCFAMVPWAGRVRDGLLPTADGVRQLPRSADGNALHGLGHVRPWQRVAEQSTRSRATYRVELGEPWPTSGIATLTYVLLDDGLRIELEWDDGTDSPCSIGLHPWFARRLSRGGEAVLTLEATTMVERGDDGLPTGRLVDPVPGPWDDCFAVAGSPTLTWPGAFELELSAGTPWWVVYDQPSGTICVEPQTAPPDAFGHVGLRPSGRWPHDVWFQLRARPATSRDT